MFLHFQKHWVFTKRRGKYGGMVVNFYEGKEKKAKHRREATFIWCQTQLSGEIHLNI